MAIVEQHPAIVVAHERPRLEALLLFQQQGQVLHTREEHTVLAHALAGDGPALVRLHHRHGVLEALVELVVQGVLGVEHTLFRQPRVLVVDAQHDRVWHAKYTELILGDGTSLATDSVASTTLDHEAGVPFVMPTASADDIADGDIYEAIANTVCGVRA